MPFYVVFIVAACIAILAVVVWVTENRQTLGVLLGFYIIGVLIITLLVRTYDTEIRTICNPFAKYINLARAVSSRGTSGLPSQKDSIREIILNILLFVPLGFLVPVRIEKMRHLWKILLLACLFSLSIEIAQLILHMGWFDTSDIVHNTLGACIGYVIWCKWLRSVRET
ncbi:MAG: VanZ family protein [Clostridiales bacterium]|nr:VanZ family protein [Clostridiales bacterium]